MWRGSKISKLLLVLTILAGAVFAAPSFALTPVRGEVLTEAQLRPLGLTRNWYFQAPVDRQRVKLEHLLYDDGVLFLVSDDAIMYAVNAETGRFLWATEIGERFKVILPPVVNSRLVAVINGSTISAFNRYTGTLVWQVLCPGEPFAGCAMSEYYLYVPLLSGKITAFNFDYSANSGNQREVVNNTATTKAALFDPQLAAFKTDNADDAEMRKIVEQFAETKRSILPATDTAEAAPPAMRLNPGSELPMYLMAFGKVWLPPVICHHEVKFMLPEVSAGEKDNTKFSYDDFVVSDLQEQVAWISDTGNVFIAGIDRLGVDDLELRYDVRIAARATSVDKDILTRREMLTNNPMVAPLTYVPPKLAPKKKAAAQQTPTDSGSSISGSSDSDSDEELSANDETDAAREENVSATSEEKIHRGLILVGTKTGYVFAIDDRLGKVCWQFSATGAILERIAEIDGTAYVCVERGGMHAVDIFTGKEKWFRPGIRNFLAASQERIYVMGADLKLTVLDRETGSFLTKGPSLEPYSLLYQNLVTDQVFLGDKSGLVQCFTEISTVTNADGDYLAAPRYYWQTSPRERIKTAKWNDAPDDNAREILAGETTKRERAVSKKDKKDKEKTTRSFLWDDDDEDDLDVFF